MFQAASCTNYLVLGTFCLLSFRLQAQFRLQLGGVGCVGLGVGCVLRWVRCVLDWVLGVCCVGCVGCVRARSYHTPSTPSPECVRCLLDFRHGQESRLKIDALDGSDPPPASKAKPPSSGFPVFVEPKRPTRRTWEVPAYRPSTSNDHRHHTRSALSQRPPPLPTQQSRHCSPDRGS